MKKILWALIVILVLVLSNLSCSKVAGKTTTSSTTIKTQTTANPSPNTTPTVMMTHITRPPAGKSQEFTFTLKAPAGVYNMVIYLAKGETLDLDWKFVSDPQEGLLFMFTTPEGREMDSQAQPINSPGQPLYDKSLPTQNPEAVVGSHVVIKVGQDKYCNEGYYTLVFSGSLSQSGTVYVRYDLE